MDKIELSSFIQVDDFTVISAIQEWANNSDDEILRDPDPNYRVYNNTTDFDKDAITVMAVDNLPCELPRDASDGFGKHLIERVLPALFSIDKEQLIDRASIAKNGQLMERFQYLQDYAS